MSSAERKPKWAWSSVDDPNPYHPKCDRCDAFARWAIARFEDDRQLDTLSPITRFMACGRHINQILSEEDWWLDALMIYDLTYPPECS